ncbi:probable purine permease 10 [Actinidia eriantha]|uniref:probable purine permease 10 n=1 Tax=Actinidia eriantha TaxID=165200 RepID=UPI00258FB318|nr:probable purine permease 10 [Actinidia eriantha]
MDISSQTNTPQLRNYKLWLRMVVFTLFVLFGQSTATLLGRVYYSKGGKSIWLAALMETLGFPILIPFSLYFSPPKDRPNYNNPTHTPSKLILAAIYASLGLLQAVDNILYSIGLSSLPVSTFSLISATQLAFNAFFSFFLNAQKITPQIVNSLFLLTISSTLLVLQNDSENSESISRRKYVIGFSCTVIASLLFSLLLSLTQLVIHKVVRRETFHAVLDMIIYQSLVATFVNVVALFASKEWNSLRKEMENFEPGRVSYVMVLVGIAVSWQAYSIGAIGLIFEVSSLFSNAIGTLGLPIVPILAVIFFHDKMNGLKVIAMLLAIWGFASYLYQQYLDNSTSQIDRGNINAIPDLSTTERCQQVE